MTVKLTEQLSHHPFWTFSCQVYEKTQDILLEMQQRQGLNVNLLLFCVWFAANNQGVLTKIEIKKLLTAIHIWHERIVLPLRALRQDLKEPGLPAWSTQARRDVLDTEISAEHIEELMLTDAAPPKLAHSRYKTTSQKAAAAWQNILTYTEVVFVNLNAMDCQSLMTLFAEVFPDLSMAEMQEICQLPRVKSQRRVSATQRQLSLPF